jgi:peptidoglycan-N-acetylglucosamine deacetylase
MSLLTVLAVVLLALLATRIIVFVTFSYRQHQRHKQAVFPLPDEKPLVSIIVPCYNEEMVVSNCVLSLQRQNYVNIEVLLVDDGSTDLTADICEQMSGAYANVKALSKPNGGKATALNYGIERATGSIVISMDADSMFLPDTIEHLVRSLQEPGVGAVAGNVRVANRNSALGKHQAVEYITGLTIQGKTFAHLGCLQVISGAIGAFDKQALLKAGGYSSDTIVEDMDVTITMARHGYRVAYNQDAIAYTEAPESMRDFLRQRYRWTFGRFQVLAKHRDTVFNHRFGRMGSVGMPYYALFPWFDVLISTLLVIAALRVAVTGNGWPFLAIYAVMSLIQACLIMYALVTDNENKRLAVMAAFESLLYNHLIAFTTLVAGINYMLGKHTVQWNKLRRLGKNTLETRTTQADGSKKVPL